MNARQSHASIILVEIKAGLRLTNLESRAPKKTLCAFQINLSLSLYPPLFLAKMSFPLLSTCQVSHQSSFESQLPSKMLSRPHHPG